MDEYIGYVTVFSMIGAGTFVNHMRCASDFRLLHISSVMEPLSFIKIIDKTCTLGYVQVCKVLFDTMKNEVIKNISIDSDGKFTPYSMQIIKIIIRLKNSKLAAYIFYCLFGNCDYTISHTDLFEIIMAIDIDKTATVQQIIDSDKDNIISALTKLCSINSYHELLIFIEDNFDARKRTIHPCVLRFITHKLFIEHYWDFSHDSVVLGYVSKVIKDEISRQKSLSQ